MVAKRGYTLIELLVTMLIIMIASIGIGTGFVRLMQIENINREKARTLEALCQRFAWTQPYVAAGARAWMPSNSATFVHVEYPHIVFGIANETNRFTFVTNTTISVRDDGVLQTVVHAGVSTGVKTITNAMDWLDPLFVNSSRAQQLGMRNSSVTVMSTNVCKAVILRYSYAIRARQDFDKVATEQEVTLTVPVRLHNGDYQ